MRFKIVEEYDECGRFALYIDKGFIFPGWWVVSWYDSVLEAKEGAARVAGYKKKEDRVVEYFTI